MTTPVSPRRNALACLAALGCFALGCAGDSSAGLPGTHADLGGSVNHPASASDGGGTDLAPLLDAGTDTAPSLDVIVPADLPPPPPLGQPIPGAKNQWTWVDFPDSVCDDGSPTGIGINPGDDNSLVIFLNGGGACWDETTCLQLNTATHGPFGKPEFEAATAVTTGSIFDRGTMQNPVRTWTMIYVPYCTGDVHGGNNVAAYSRPYYHKGHANLEAFLARIAATVPTPDKLLFTGSSAGGYGSGLNFDTARRYFPATKAYLLDDSGPPLIGDEIPSVYRDDWYQSWRLDLLLDPICMACRDDLSQLLAVLGQKYPNDRMALLSSLQDAVISGYLLKTPQQFQTDVVALGTTVIAPNPNGRYFFVPGNTHTMLGSPGLFTTTDGVSLWSWVTQMITDDPAWVSHMP